MQTGSTTQSHRLRDNRLPSWFQRPVFASAIFVMIFDGESGSISLRRLDASGFDFGPTLDDTQVAAWQANPGVSSSM